MVETHYRWDFIGLSTDTKPTPETSEKVVDGSTFYCSDNSKLYVYCKDKWYEKTVSGGGGTSYTAGTGIDITGTEISVDTDTIQPKLTAGTGIDIIDNTISATGGVTELTSADYNYPVANPSAVAAWLLDEGVYVTADNIQVYSSANNSITAKGTIFIVSGEHQSTGTKSITQLVSFDSAPENIVVITNVSDGSRVAVYKLTSVVSQSTGTSTTDVMSQKAVTSMVFYDPATQQRIQIGKNSKGTGTYCVAIGGQANANYGASAYEYGVAIGSDAKAGYNGGSIIPNATGTTAIGASAHATSKGTIALGYGASATNTGEMNIGSSFDTAYGYNNSNYRLLTGLYDPQSAHDAATKGYVDPTTDSSAPTTSTVGRLGQIQIDTTNADAYMCVAVDTVTPAYTWKKITA